MTPDPHVRMCLAALALLALVVITGLCVQELLTRGTT